jgi:hypothetical protein
VRDRRLTAEQAAPILDVLNRVLDAL